MRRVVFILTLISSFLITRAVFAYDDKTTHPALTDEIIDFYNLNFAQKITAEEKEWIVSGSIKEDTEPRYINHFYDPVYKEGWTGEKTNDWASQELMQKFSDVILSPESAVSSLDWVHNQELQEKYQRYDGNQTWEKAVYEYVKNNNKEKAYYALGHVLHLLEDMSVPEHTRNDTHPNDSPYENYAKKYTRENLNIANGLSGNYQPTIFNSLDVYFESLSNYSNNYFFSKDTVNIEKYSKPKIMKYDEKFGYGLDISGSTFPLARVDVYTEGGISKITYFLDEKEGKILDAYWMRLSREAVLSGAGVINLFFQEVEKAKKDPSLLKPPPENQSAIVSFYGEIVKTQTTVVNAANAVINAADKTIDAMSDVLDKWVINTTPAAVVVATKSDFVAGDERPAMVVSGSGAGGGSISGVEPAEPELRQPAMLTSLAPSAALSVITTATTSTSTAVSTSSPTPGVGFTPSLPYPGFGGGGSSAVVQNTQEVQQTEEAEEEPEAQENNNNDEANNSEQELEEDGDEDYDDTPPDIFFAIEECLPENLKIITDSGCLLIGAASLHLSWQTSADDLDYFELTRSTISGQDQISTTTATSTEFAILDNSANILSVRAKDVSGNWSEPETIEVEIFSMPVVINEIAWMGTSAEHPTDEWIELYNRTSKTIDLNNWILYSDEERPWINLSGQISANGYYLIERTDDEAISDIAGDWKGSFGNGLSGSQGSARGENLYLVYFSGGATTTVDEVLVCGARGDWCGGGDYRTMERYEPDIAGSDSSNWGTNNMLIKNGKGAEPQFADVIGTPKARNSLNYLINKNNPNIISNLTLTKSKSPYLVDNTVITVQPDETLTIEPGVVIGFYNDAGLNISGKIVAQGTIDEPIIFTRFGDSGYWYGVSVVSGNESFFDHAIFSYGGKWYSGAGNSMANLEIKDSSAAITNSIFEHSGVYGLKLTNSNSTVSNNIFRYNQEPDPAGYGGSVVATGGMPSISANQFLNNKKGLYLLTSPGLIESNYFEGNSEGAIYSFGRLPNFTNNSGVNNGLNSINIWGNLTQANDSILLNSNSLPYLLKGYETPVVLASSTLTIGMGAVIKSAEQSISVYGNLVIAGENPEDIIFTSLYDDSTGGDTNNDADSTLPAPGQFPGIFIGSTGSLNAKGFTMRYAGSNSLRGNDSAGIMVYGGIADVANAVFNNNYPYAVYAANSPNIKIENTRFENHNFSGPWGQKAALGIFSSSVFLSNISFINNALGVMSDVLSTFTTDTIEFLDNLATTTPPNLW